MRVTVRRGASSQAQSVEVLDGATAADAVRSCGLHPDLTLVVRGTEPIPSDTRLIHGDEIRFVNVASGG